MDAARLIRNILDMCEISDSSANNITYCRKVIDAGCAAVSHSVKSKTLGAGFAKYLQYKSHLGRETLKDMKYIGQRLFRNSPKMRNATFPCLTPPVCEKWLAAAFSTSRQYNKGRIFLSGFFNFAIRNDWLLKNPIALVQPKRVVETEIKPLSLPQIKSLLAAAESPTHRECAAALFIMLWAGIRPKEITRMKWGDIDLEEAVISVRPQNSKTGGARHIEIHPPLNRRLKTRIRPPETPICPPDWGRKWKRLRDDAGFKGIWVNDVLRHTFASYYMKHFKNIVKLQSEMGHYDLELLRTRYVNMSGLTKAAAARFFKL